MKKWRVTRSLFAITLSAAVAFTAVPETSFVSNAAEAYEVTAPDEEPVVEEPTVSDGDSILDPELYQSKKLKITPKQTAVFTGQSDVLVAQIGYESTTSDDGLGYEVSS